MSKINLRLNRIYQAFTNVIKISNTPKNLLSTQEKHSGFSILTVRVFYP